VSIKLKPGTGEQQKNKKKIAAQRRKKKRNQHLIPRENNPSQGLAKQNTSFNHAHNTAHPLN